MKTVQIQKPFSTTIPYTVQPNGLYTSFQRIQIYTIDLRISMKVCVAKLFLVDLGLFDTVL